MADEKLGVAFSGGGIRSAAFCSGVLRRLLDKNKEPDYLSCVSGGGYTGSAYVQWKYFKEHLLKDKDMKWPDQFFDHMRENTGHICNWYKPCEGIKGSCALFGLFFAIISPVVGWFFFSFPIALVINLLYGQFLDGTRCRKNGDSIDCQEHTWLFLTSILFFIFFHLVEYFSKNKKSLQTAMPKATLKLGQLISGSTFAFTFFPWFINDFLQYTGLHIRLGIILITAFFWFFVPILRKYSSLVFVIYGYSYTVYWRMYKGFFFKQYTEERFRAAMIASLVIIAVFSVLGEFPQRLGYIYNRWRLQKAFYYEEEHSYCYDCFPGGHCCCCCACPPKPPPSTNEKKSEKIEPGERALTLKDIDVGNLGGKPLYISSMVANNWRREDNRKYCLLTMSPKGISVIDKQPGNKSKEDVPGNKSKEDVPGNKSKKDVPGNKPVVVDINSDEFIKGCLHSSHFDRILSPGKLSPKLSSSDIKLSSSMAMSAAAVSPYFGRHEEIERQFTHILSVCGIEMGANIVLDMTGERNEKWWKACWLYLGNFIISGCFLVCGALLLFRKLELPSQDTALSVQGTMAIMFPIIALLILLLLRHCIYQILPSWLRCTCTCQKLSGCCCATWCGVHVPIYRFVRSMLHIISYDAETPPAMMHISDGGHFENYGLLPLLKLRLPKILLVHGLEIKSDDDYAKDIIVAMEHARKLFNCSFTSITENDVVGGDVLTNIKNEFVGKRSRKYEFKVHYPEDITYKDADDENGIRLPASEGHIVLIAPRRPGKATSGGSSDPERVGDDIELSQPGAKTCDKIRGDVMSAGEASTSQDNQSHVITWKLDTKKWGVGPYMTDEELKNIEGCPGGIGCCERCHKNLCGNCFKFPRHPTMNQFFTPPMFTAYHREGYRACMECDI